MQPEPYSCTNAGLVRWRAENLCQCRRPPRIEMLPPRQPAHAAASGFCAKRQPCQIPQNPRLRRRAAVPPKLIDAIPLMTVNYLEIVYETRLESVLFLGKPR
jgi:hypothetical protein